ncbi:DUF3540 domain-containing protein [Polyangium aurulentum]|uniref:DUF3540 domain-containing protein n=1 Tax=Polyangium aurulentum TaxID=2567896 RepID=UPI00146A53CE|nr:DUF3540 domain-containing protein [Polyangium aurulentum]UQA56916.1 DUF3540 domain-containing protein [Polyangium aurulentum]
MAKQSTAQKKAQAEILPLAGGGSVTVENGAAEIRDAEGRVVVRYLEGRAEIEVPDGDLVLAAPRGKVSIRAGSDLELSAEGELRQRAGGEVSVVATRILHTASHLAQKAERIEVTATRLVERTRDAYREATGLLETRAGRARAVVDDIWSLLSRRTTMASKDDTSIDGKRVLLG